MNSECMSKAEQSSLDIISTLPQPLLETILCLLPTKESAKTSILSREWRYKWTKLPKLKFYLSQVSKRITEKKEIQGKKMGTKCKRFYDLRQILLSRQGPIHDFTIIIDLWFADDDPFELDQIILHLSKNHTVKKLTLSGPYGEMYCYDLPKSVFSLHHLTDLDLYFFDLSCFDSDHELIFNGFGNLRRLSLRDVIISTKTLQHLLSNCPSLKSLALLIGGTHRGSIDCTFTELFECLPMIEDLTTYHKVSEWLALYLVPKELPTSLFKLKYLCFQEVYLHDGYGLSFLLVLIKCSPNLEKITIRIFPDDDSYDQEYPEVWKEYADVWLEHLKELEIGCFDNTKRIMKFLKFILARSPKLEKVSIRHVVEGTLESEMLETLLQAPRASPIIIPVQ